MSLKIKNHKAHSQAREIILNVFKYFQNKNQYLPKCKLTAEANGYSVMSVRRIVCEGKNTRI